MISVWITVGLVIAAFGVASLGAYFSITGLGALFSGAVMAVWLMAGSLEFAKFMLAAYLHQTWKNQNIIYRSYLTFSIVVLSTITSIGIYGFLSDAYQSASSVYESETIRTESIKTQQANITAELNRLNKLMTEIPENRVSKRLKLRSEIEPQIQELNKKLNESEKVLTLSNLKLIEVKKKVGPLIHISKSLDMSIDRVVNYLIAILVSVFDPLAICLVIASTHAIESQKLKVSVRKREEEDFKDEHINSEQKFFTPPVAEVKTNEPASDDIVVQMNFKDPTEDKKAV